VTIRSLAALVLLCALVCTTLGRACGPITLTIASGRAGFSVNRSIVLRIDLGT